jgi:tetratricopeptide (TPR) repeat protein
MAEEEAAVIEDTAPVPAAVADADYDREDEEVDDVVYDRPLARRGGRRSRGLRTGSRRRVARVTLLVAGVLVVIASVYATRGLTRQYWESPEARLREAERLVEKGEFERASAVYASFAAAYPAHRERPNAQFLSANLLRAVQPDNGGRAKRLNERALDRFRTFIRENQGNVEDAKLARAEIQVGMLHFELGEYEEALSVLSDPDLLLRDSGGKVPVLRVLAGTHARLGDYQTALKFHGQAAADVNNASQDRDHVSQAQLYESMSDRAASVPEGRKYYRLALEHWRKARNVPGLSPSRTREIGARIGLLEDRLGVEETSTTLPPENSRERPTSGTSSKTE